MSINKEAGPIQTFTGRMVHVDAFNRDDANLQDIATSLSRLARFNGHTRYFYSVAQHSAIVALVAADLAFGTTANDTPALALKAARWGLLHDAHEAWLGDVPGPLKAMTEKLNDHTFNIDRVVRQAFGLPEYTDTDVAVLVTEADRLVLAREASDLLRHDTGWSKGLKRWERGVIDRPMEHDEARDKYLHVWGELFGVHAQLTQALMPDQVAALLTVLGVKLIPQNAEGQP
ncbi:MAG: YfbR-like 5'-deoxynucleotidase [Phycisphaerales bacterium]|jgi:5'-deoxynucleotidase YfbR-like HD superfamily hydrolase|nr:hypothetical protein [Phycisphaeraceae bacterium]